MTIHETTNLFMTSRSDFLICIETTSRAKRRAGTSDGNHVHANSYCGHATPLSRRLKSPPRFLADATLAAHRKTIRRQRFFPPAQGRSKDTGDTKNNRRDKRRVERGHETGGILGGETRD